MGICGIQSMLPIWLLGEAAGSVCGNQVIGDSSPRKGTMRKEACGGAGRRSCLQLMAYPTTVSGLAPPRLASAFSLWAQVALHPEPQFPFYAPRWEVGRGMSEGGPGSPSEMRVVCLLSLGLHHLGEHFGANRCQEEGFAPGQRWAPSQLCAPVSGP